MFQAPSKQRSSSSRKTKRTGGLLMSWSCSEDALLRLIAGRDPTGKGLEGVIALRLLQRLLHWDPLQRPTALQALNHAYFTNTTAPATGSTVATANAQGGAKASADNSNNCTVGAGSGSNTSNCTGPLSAQATLEMLCSDVPIGTPGWC